MEVLDEDRIVCVKDHAETSLCLPALQEQHDTS